MTSGNVAYGKWNYYESKTGNIWPMRSYVNGIFDGQFSSFLDKEIYQTEAYKNGQNHGQWKKILNASVKKITHYEKRLNHKNINFSNRFSC
jgi:hypothetical protein